MTHQGFTDRMGATPYTQAIKATHTFLKLVQPIPTATLMQINDIQANETRLVPFTFIVPGHALPTICRHHTESPAVRDAHLQLPPSLGAGSEVPSEEDGTGITKLEDYCPNMVTISYFIRVKLHKANGVDDEGRARTRLVAEETRKLRVIPATAEQPPINIQGQEEEYCLRRVKAIKRGMFKPSSGHFIMESTQPSPLRLPAPTLSCANLNMESLVHTVGTVTLRFDPDNVNDAPPKLAMLNSKLKILTFYQSTPLEDWPKRTTLMHDSRRQVNIDTVGLSSRNMGSVQWRRYDSSTGPPNYPIPAPPSHNMNPNKPYYLAQLLVPLTLPPNKHFVPTFHSCLVSRIYSLELTQEFKATGNNLNQSCTLRVPVQILSEPREGAGTVPTPAYAEPDEDDNEEELGDYFTPRTIGPPPPSFTAAASSAIETDQLPPQYDDVPQPPTRTRRHASPAYEDVSRSRRHASPPYEDVGTRMMRHASPPYDNTASASMVRQASPPYEDVSPRLRRQMTAQSPGSPRTQPGERTRSPIELRAVPASVNAGRSAMSDIVSMSVARGAIR